MSEDNGLVHAILLDGEGGGRELTWEEAKQWTPEQGVLWMHLDRSSETAQKWVENDSGLVRWSHIVGQFSGLSKVYSVV